MENKEKIEIDDYITFYVNEKTGKVLVGINDFSYSEFIADTEFNRKHYKITFFNYLYNTIVISIALIIFSAENCVYFLIPYLFASSAIKLFQYNKATMKAIDVAKTIKTTAPKV